MPLPIGRPAFGCLIELLQTLVLTAVIFLGIQTFVAQPFKVEGRSMERTVEPEQYVLVDKLSPRWSAFSPGDIVVLQPPDIAAEGEPFIKRVIGVGGDHVQIRDGRVYVNDAALQEPYVFPGEDGLPQRTDPTSGQSEWFVAVGDVFVMGD